MSPRNYIWVVLLVAVLVVIAVLGGRGGFTSSTPSLPPEQGVNRIAFVDLDAQVRSMNPDGSDVRQISSGEGSFTWPTWSPDARTLVYSGVVTEEAGSPRISLFAFNAASGSTREIYVSEPGIVGFLADDVVHYTLWSPDSSRLAIVVVTSRGLSLLIDDLGHSAGADFVLDQGPLWLSWSHDSRYLLVHRGADHFLVNTLDGNQVNQLDLQAFAYRVPAWKPHQETVTFVSGDRLQELTLSTADVIADGLDLTQPIAEVPAYPAFLWSPDGAFLAVAGPARVFGYQDKQLFIYLNLRLYPEDKEKQPVEIRDNILAYFWSPDGTKLAYVTLSEKRGVLRWMVFNVADGSRLPLVDFTPSPDQLTMFQFFDQYSYSHSLWSADSQSLVFAGRLSTEAVSASWGLERSVQGSHIIVVDVSPIPSPASIAEGSLGFWSPR